MITRIHVNGHNLRLNKKDGGNRPVFTAKTYKDNRVGNHVEIGGPSRLVWGPSKPLAHGAVAWIETKGPVWVYV